MYLDMVEGNKKNMWAITIQMQGKSIVVKVDTGVEVTAISDTTWKSLNIAKPLKETEVSLYDPDQMHLKILGNQERCCLYYQRSKE